MISNSSDRLARSRPLPPATARSVALEILLQREEPGDFIEHRLERVAGFTTLSEEDRRLAREIAFGVLRNRTALDRMIAARTDGRPQRPVLRGILQSAVYQLLFLDRIPDHAAVNEAVLLARQRGFGAQSGFVNAVLRGITREKEACRKALEALRTQDPARGWSHPEWLVQRWAATLGEAGLQRLLAWNNAAPTTLARVNRLKTTSEALLSRWRSEGVECSPVGVDWADPLYEGKASITVTSARWGWLTVDDRVARATEMAAKDLWDMRETRFGRAGFGEFAAVIVRQNQALADLLRPLVSHSPGWLPGIA